MKNHFTLGWEDYRHQYEPIVYGWREGGTHYWCGDRDQGDAWMINRPAANREHPTMKPVELVERATPEQQQVARHDPGPVRRERDDDHRVREDGAAGARDRTGPEVLRRDHPSLAGVRRTGRAAQESGRAFDDVVAGVEQARPVSQ